MTAIPVRYMSNCPSILYLSVMQLSVDVDLSLRDVSREVGNGMGDVVVGHSQNWDLNQFNHIVQISITLSPLIGSSTYL